MWITEDWIERTYRTRIVCELVGGVVLIAFAEYAARWILS